MISKHPYIGVSFIFAIQTSLFELRAQGLTNANHGYWCDRKTTKYAKKMHMKSLLTLTSTPQCSSANMDAITMEPICL